MNKPIAQSLLVATDEQLTDFKEARKQRASRTAPVFMLIDDQKFSVKLLETALNGAYTLHTAMDAKEGFSKYLAVAPDILWLDIDMPVTNGHQVAESINAVDPDAYIIMVTANEYLEEGAKANRNRVKGFINKPYSKKKIRDCVEKFVAERSK